MTETRSARARVAALLLAFPLLGLKCSSPPGGAETTVVRVRGDRVYIALRDSSALQQGALLTFARDGRSVATGTVIRVYDGEIAIATLTSGSLEEVGKLDRVRISSQKPSFEALPALRVGYPSGRRSNLVLSCDETVVSPRLTRGVGRTEVLAPDTYRLVPDSSIAPGAPWPDSLLIRRFDDVADQEIALERGELDVAVFWPGELSSHMREGSRSHRVLHGRRSRGLIAAIVTGAGANPGPPLGDAALASLNRQIFRGDLAPWTDVGAAARPESGAATPSVEVARFLVDSSLPGRRVLERFLNRGRAGGDGDERAAASVFYLDCPVDSPDSIALAVARHVAAGPFSAALRARADWLTEGIEGAAEEPSGQGWLPRSLDELNVTPLFTLRCPVVCAPELGPYVSALGAEAFADMLGCGPRRPP